MNSLTPSEPYAYGSNLDIVWQEDPRLLGMRLARYKFVAKMFAGLLNVIEVGAGDGALSRIVKQSVVDLTLTDAHPVNPDVTRWNPTTTRPDRSGYYEGAYALDVLEHIPARDEEDFLSSIRETLTPEGSLIIGSPSLESQAYASRKSRESHVNCKTEDDLRNLLRKHFRRVFMFGMNDEVVHTGFGPMCHYRLALCV